LNTLCSRARRLVAESDIAAFAVDAHKRILAWNDEASELLGFSSGDVVGRDGADVIEPRDGFGNWVCPGRLLHRRQMEERREPGGAAAGFQLTDRQRQVLTLLAEGKSMAEIGKAIGVSVNTVRHHMQRVLGNLDCHSQAEAVAVAIRHQLI
jgi:PAS domain S-box-containing protein